MESCFTEREKNLIRGRIRHEEEEEDDEKTPDCGSIAFDARLLNWYKIIDRLSLLLPSLSLLRVNDDIIYFFL